MTIWIHTWSWMPRWHIYDQDTSTSKTQPQPSNMVGILRTSKVLWHLQSRTTHCHVKKIWRTPKTTLSDHMHIRKNHSQAHHRQVGDIHWIQSGCQTRRQHGTGTMSILNDGLRWNTRRQVDVPRTKQSLIYAQRKLTKINRTTSEPPTWHLLVWNTIRFILHALCRQWRICFWIQDWHQKRHYPPFWPLCSVRTWNAHQNEKKTSKTECIFPRPKISSIHEQYRSLLSPPPLCLYRRKRATKRDARVRTKYIPSAAKHQL